MRVKRCTRSAIDYSLSPIMTDPVLVLQVRAGLLGPALVSFRASRNNKAQTRFGSCPDCSTLENTDRAGYNRHGPIQHVLLHLVLLHPPRTRSVPVAFFLTGDWIPPAATTRTTTSCSTSSLAYPRCTVMQHSKTKHLKFSSTTSTIPPNLLSNTTRAINPFPAYAD